MGRKKRRSSKFRDSSTVIDMEQARKERRERQEKRNKEKLAREKRGQQRQRHADMARRQTQRLQENIGRVVDAAEEAVSAQLDGPSAERQDRRRMELRKRRNKQRLAIACAAAIIIVALGISAGRILVLKHDLHVANKQKQEYIEEKEQLQEDLKEIDDKSNLEEQARNQMRLIRPDETLYIFPEDVSQPEDETPEEETQED